MTNGSTRMAERPLSILNTDEFVSQMQSQSTAVTSRLGDVLRELGMRLGNPQVAEMLSPRAEEILGYLDRISQQIPQYYSGEQENDMLAQVSELMGSTYLISVIPEREMERRRAGLEENVIEQGYVNRPGTPPIEQRVARTHLSEASLDVSGLNLPSQWDSHFGSDEERDDAERTMSDGMALELMRDFDGARNAGQQVVSNISSQIQTAYPSSGFNLLDPSTWTPDQEQFIVDMLGKAEWSAEERASFVPVIAEILNLINEGRFAEAFDRAPSDSTLGQAILTLYAETLEQRMSMHIPVGYLNIGFETSIVNVQFAGDEQFRLFFRGFLKAVLNQKYSPAVRITEADGRNVLDVTMQPTEEFGGGVGGGGEFGAQFTLGDRLRTVTFAVGAAYDPVSEQPVFTGRMEFSDQSGEWRAPIDGVLYPTIYLEGAVDAAGSTGHVGVGALLEAGSSYFVFEDWSMFLLISLDYVKRFGEQVVQPGQDLWLGGGGKVAYSDTLSVEGRFLYNPLNDNIGAIGQAMVNVGAGVYIGFSGGARQMDINVIGRNQTIWAPEGSLNIGFNIDEMVDYIRGGE